MNKDPTHIQELLLQMANFFLFLAEGLLQLFKCQDRNLTITCIKSNQEN